MNNFTFWSPTKFVFGRDTEQHTAELVAEFGGKKVLIVYGGGSVVRSGLLDRVTATLDAAGIGHVALGGVKPNPTDDKVYEGIDLARRENVDFILAVGGGSVIDTAKAIAAGALYDGDFWDFYCGKCNVKKAIPLGVVLTIPAAGSEGSGNSVITKLDGRQKLSIRTDSELRPRFAVMDPVLTFTLPPYQTACGIVDMLAHIFERYFSNTDGCEVTDRVAEGLMVAVMHESHKVIVRPDDYDARANIMWAGTLAHNGLCGTGRAEDWASHFMEHELSALYDVAHGAGLAVVFPAWLTYVVRTNPGKIAVWAERVMNVTRDGRDDTAVALDGIACLKDFYRAIGMPVTLGELGVPDADIDALVTNVHRHKGNEIGQYVKLSPDDTRAIYMLMRD